MKIYINSLHQIRAVNFNDTKEELTEIEVPEDFLQGYCDTLIKAFCYHEWVDDEGHNCVSVYPYKDFSVMESIQEQNTIRESQFLATQKASVDLDFRVSLMEVIP